MEPRKQQILQAVVREFADSAVPVGSMALVRRHFVNLSSATIRSELANLADLGYLEQPHTSAGRVPTDRGYRYYVDFLMGPEHVPAQVDAFIALELGSVPADPGGLLEKVATTLATVTQTAAVATSPHGPLARIKHVDLISLEPRDVLLIVLVEGNLLRQQVVNVAEVIEQKDLTQLAARINRDLVGRDRDEVEVRALGAEGADLELLNSLAEILRQFEQGAGTMVVHDGVRNLIRQPEFAEASRLRDVLEVLEETRMLAALLHELAGDTELQVVIGSENRTEQLRGCTIALTTYGPTRSMRGVLGVIGPTRMDYDRVVSRLWAVARHASNRMADAV
ncbi:MAG TPA: heat-inducible transcriptional repressor HrcA [Candidatus Dormibacteraeota bacterium]|jgi:heat-inducible transcriptional repressor|nr:heat-inducible transcriptional repressor HrcA [Candidatus Dormibacteraeota bacterium]